MNTAIVSSYHYYRDFITQFSSFVDAQLGNICRKIEISISNRTFLFKDYDATLKLPAMYLQFTALTSRPEKNNPLFFNTSNGPGSVFKSHILLNETKNEYIETLLQHNYISIDVTINTASQLEALEIQQILNHMFLSNVYFRFDFNTLIPIPNEFLNNWDLVNDNIYYLYTQFDHNLGKTVNYGLVNYTTLIKPNQSNTMSTDYQDNQSVTINFEGQLLTPVRMYKNTNPNEIKYLVFNLGVNNLPLTIYSYDLINYIEQKYNYRLYRGYIINNTNLTKYNNEYQITINDNTFKNKPYVTIITLDSNTYLSSTIDNNVNINFDNNNNTIISISPNNDTQQQLLEDILSGKREGEVLIFTGA